MVDLVMDGPFEKSEKGEYCGLLNDIKYSIEGGVNFQTPSK